MFGNHYEVDPALAGARVQLLFDPFELSEIEVRFQGRPMGKALPRVIRRHTHPAARAETPQAPKPSGIDYLGLVAARVAAEQARRIAYAGIGTDEPGTGHDNAEHSGEEEEEEEEEEERR